MGICQRGTAVIALLALVCVQWLGLGAATADVPKRVALVVGVSSYSQFNSLPNAVRDAQAVSKALKGHSYDVVEVYDPDYKAFKRANSVFKERLKSAEEALFYYAGHGMEANLEGDNHNILAPSDAEMTCETRSALYVVTMNEVMRAMEGVPNRVVIIDACRDNPLKKCPVRSAGEYGFRQALPPGGSLEKTILVFSTDAGAVASDGPPGEHSPFAKSLLASLNAQPRLRYRELLDDVSGNVRKLTGRQVPWVVTVGGVPDTCPSGTQCLNQKT